MQNKHWLIICSVVAVLFTGLGYWLHKPLPNEGGISDWWTAPIVPSVETAWKDRWKTKEKVVVLQGATVTITKDRVTVQKGDSVYVKECPKKPRLTFNSFSVEGGAGLVGIGTAPMVGYEAALTYKPVTIAIKGDVSASVYIRAGGQISGADQSFEGAIFGGARIDF